MFLKKRIRQILRDEIINVLQKLYGNKSHKPYISLAVDQLAVKDTPEAIQIKKIRAFIDKQSTDLTEKEHWALITALVDLEREKREINYLEIGVAAGGTLNILKFVSENTNFTGIDLFEDFVPNDDNTHIGKVRTLEKVNNNLGKDVQLIKGESIKLLKEFKNNNNIFDFIFIDANHTYAATNNDFNNAIPVLSNRGLVAFHNCSFGEWPDQKYVLNDGGPWKLTQEVKERDDFRLEIEVDRIRIYRKLF